MSDPINNALLFLINTLFSLYLFILVIRLILVWVRTDYFNPLTQFVVKLTDFLVKPLRRILPNIKNLETASFLWILVIETIKFYLVSILTFGAPNLTGLPILAVGDFLSLLIQVFTFAIIIQVILSFVQPMSPFTHVLYKITSPIMRPIQKLIPPVGGFDITPIPALIILQLLAILLVSPIIEIGRSIAFG